MNDTLQRYINTHSKSQFVGLLLTFFFGPLGLLYSNWVAAVLLTLVALPLVATLFVPAFCWFIALLLSVYSVRKYNQKVGAEAALVMQNATGN